MPTGLKAEQKRFVDYSQLYFENSEESAVAGSDVLGAHMQKEQMKTDVKTAQMSADAQAKAAASQSKASTPAAKANKTIATRKAVHGRSTVTKPALAKLKQNTGGTSYGKSRK